MTERWKPKRAASRAAYFSHKHGPKPQPSGREYVPKPNRLLDQERLRASREPSMVTTECLTTVRPRYELTVPGAILHGHKQGYEFVSDAAMIPLMGKKTA